MKAYKVTVTDAVTIAEAGESIDVRIIIPLSD